jgi:hypothetical protein
MAQEKKKPGKKGKGKDKEPIDFLKDWKALNPDPPTVKK